MVKTLKNKRRDKFLIRFEMYSDNYRSQVEKKLGQIYTAMTQLKLDVQINDNNNLYKQVVNTISNVYSFGVKRVFKEEGARELYNTLRVDKVMTQANKFMNAFNDVILQVSWDFDKKLPILMLRLPHTTEVEYSGGEVKSVIYFVECLEKDKKERWAYWSKDKHYYIDKSADKEKIVPIKGNNKMINPLGVLPFVFIHNGWRDASFWDVYTGDDLTGGTINLAVHLTFLNHILKTQSFKQLVGKGDNVDKLLGQVLDPLSVLRLSGQNTEIDVLDLQTNFDMLNKVVQDLANNIAVNYNISPSQFRMTGQVSSGFALQMENLKLDRFTIEQQQDFKIHEKDLFNLLKKVLDVYDSSSQLGDSVLVDFVEPYYPASPKEQTEIDRQMIDLGLTSPQEVLMRINPDLDETMAKAAIEENINARNEMLNKISSRGSITATVDALGLNLES